MKFILNTTEFKNAIEKVLKIPSAENVRLSIKSGICYLSSANITQFVMTQITAKSKTNVDIVLTEERTFAKALKFYTDDKIEFECADNTLNITCGGKKANQKLLDVKSFPKIPTVGSKTNNNFNYSNEKLKERFNTIKYAIAQNNARPALTGVYFNGTDMVGIDGCRIALNKDKALNISNAFIVPANAIKLANDVLNDNITITTDNKYIEFKDQYTTVTNRLLEGEYPKYNDFIGSKGKKIINVDVKEFINGLNYLKTFKSAKDKAIARWLGDKISDTNGTVDSKIKVDNPAALDIEIGFNADYMIEALSQFKDNVKIFVKNTVSPIIMTHPKNDIIAALFPVRIKN